MFELVRNLPRYEASYRDLGTVWCQEIVHELERDLSTRLDELKRFLAIAMIVISSGLRGSAQNCHERAMLLPSTADDGHGTPRLTSQQSRLTQGVGTAERAHVDACSDADDRPESTTARAVNYVVDTEAREAARSDSAGSADSSP